MLWHTRIEQKVIRKYGGKPLSKYGYDGILRGRPVEVRAARKDSRYSIQKDVHRHLVANQGSYIFVNRYGISRRLTARQVSARIGDGGWYKDRGYPHKFLKVNQVF
tara:strand:- start:37 stop:354 length:318 start_codon:yes stop_codon:yes gene_type:complete